MVTLGFRSLYSRPLGRTGPRLLAALLLSATTSVLLASTALAAGHVGSVPTKCTTPDSSTTACRIIPASGTFTLPIPGAPAHLVGVGTPDRAGKPIVISRASLVCPSLGGIGISIRTPSSSGLLPPLHWTNGTLYYRPASAQSCTAVASPALAAAPGVYQVVPTSSSTSGVTRMPTSGGATGHRAPDRFLLLLIGALMVLFGAGARLAPQMARK
jgi:hypothetical protein